MNPSQRKAAVARLSVASNTTPGALALIRNRHILEMTAQRPAEHRDA